MAAPPWMPPGVVGWPPNGLSGGMHTRLLGFVKTALMRQLVPPNSLVCDLFCGRGLDTERWAEAGIGRYIGVDLSASALEEAQEQWQQHEKPFPAEFCELDPCMMDLEAHLQDHGLPADIVSCLAHLQDSFTSEEMVKRLLKNVEAVLKPGGFFFGTAPDSSTIWYKYQKAVQDAMKAGSLRVNGTLPAVRAEMYKITFDDDRFLPFGSKYHMRFTDDGLPPQPQLLVHFPSLIRLAKEVGLECVEIQNLMEFYEDYSGPFSDVFRSCCGSLMDLKGVPVLDAKGRLNPLFADVLSLYTTFIFKKGDSTMSTGVEPMFKASKSAGRYLTNFPRQISGKISYSVEEELARQEQEPVKSDEHVPVLSHSSTPSSLLNEQPQHDCHRYNSETHIGVSGENLSASRPHLETWPDREEEVSELMHEASPGQNINNTTGPSFNHRKDQSHEPTEDHSSKRRRIGSRKSQALISVEDAQAAAVEHVFQHRGEETQPSKEASNSDGTKTSLPEREKIHLQLSTSVGHKSPKFSGPSESTEGGQLSSLEIERVDKLSPADQSSKHSKGRNEDLDAGNGVVQHQEPPVTDHSSLDSPKRTSSERMDESSRGEEQQDPPSDRSPKHYKRRSHEKSGRGEIVRTTHENREDGNRSEIQQDQQRPDHDSKQRTVENIDQSNRHESPPKDVTRIYERRRHDSLDDRSRNTKHQDPSATDNSSKHCPSDSSNERLRNEQTYDKGRPQNGRPKWADRSGLQIESHDPLQSSQGGRISRLVVKKFPAAGGKQNSRTAYVEDDARSPHLRNK
ncbi:unnamed protein product [Calypogeia fissa]